MKETIEDFIYAVAPVFIAVYLTMNALAMVLGVTSGGIEGECRKAPIWVFPGYTLGCYGVGARFVENIPQQPK